ncbi:YigZ family protein [Nonomuraea dietziae]|uniref:YigZ family protein n=1 Tax=Nonomuraea dietziae TaxID=65515 RepID=UPI0031D528AD
MTRYFGGVLLGAGGLVRAYGSAVTETLDRVEPVRMVPPDWCGCRWGTSRRAGWRTTCGCRRTRCAR